MPPAQRKRRTVAEEDEGGQEQSSDEEASRSTQRRRRRPVEDEESAEEDAGNHDRRVDEDQMDIDEEEEEVEGQDQLVKKLVRYALACEYSRIPIKREGIRERVLGKHKVSFKVLFETAQKQLRDKFGMEMTELPVREKVTLKDRRAAQQVNNKPLSSNTWVLTSTLPAAYRSSTIQSPSLIPSTFLESSYVALYTMIIALISLSGGALSEANLEKYLRRMNAEVNMPMGQTEACLAKMIRQGYLIKIQEGHGDDETKEWMVGPRGKVEVGYRGVKELVKDVYGENAPQDLAARIKSSMGLQMADDVGVSEELEGRQANVEEPQRRGRGRLRRVGLGNEEE